MILKDIFEKSIDRPIEGVIKADDTASLRTEIEEYVLTHEVAERLSLFFEAYNNYTGANGVWISGFFGSGKSHLLKMLAILLQNQSIDGVSALELFLPKLKDHLFLKGSVEKAVSIPSQSILFNIDQKADVISKTQIDALLSVFVKVFDETCGYYGKQGHIAQFERELDSRQLYESFKSAYEKIAQQPWEKGREQALLESSNIAQAYSQITGEPESLSIGILDKYRSQYRVSIEDFAEQVQAYIEKQPAGFRLNFFVDEVGQYIADNTKLMTNLQTIAESLATKCRGRAWVIVTAQEDMDKVVGDMNKNQGNDFSKIQARFATRLKLMSSDVAEVIQRRLLQKKASAKPSLLRIYTEQNNNFKTLFSFADGARAYPEFQSEEHFEFCYPFVPYQFTLFQSVIQNLSDHQAFEGRHSSVGERSMLGVFQQVAIQLENDSLGQIASFDRMFEGIRTTLKSNIQRAIIQADAAFAREPFIARVLKALFLVKYVKEFKASVRNLCILLRDSFEQSQKELEDSIKEALNRLERETYIQRNGDFYEYLTDEEKDIEQEIKNTEIDSTEIFSELKKLIFDVIIVDNKIIYQANKYPYLFSTKLDGQRVGREHDLGIHVITPFYAHFDDEDLVRQESVFHVEDLVVVLPPDDRLVLDLLMYMRTERYVRIKDSQQKGDETSRILSSKRTQNSERYIMIQQHLKALMGQAVLMINGSVLTVGSEDAKNRIVAGFQLLVESVYTQLGTLKNAELTENQIQTTFDRVKNSILSSEEPVQTEAERELFAFIQGNKQLSIRTTLKALVDKFEHKPYGWPYAAILCHLAILCARGTVTVKAAGQRIEDAQIVPALRNSRGHDSVVLEPQENFSASEIRALKEFYSDFFDKPAPANEAKALGEATASALHDRYEEFKSLSAQAADFPFCKDVLEVEELLGQVVGKPYEWYLKELPRYTAELLDIKDECMDGIMAFMHGSQKSIFLETKAFMQKEESNFAYIQCEEVGLIQEVLQNPDCFRGSQVSKLKAWVEVVKASIHAKRLEEQEKNSAKLQALREKLAKLPQFEHLVPEHIAKVQQAFDDVKREIEAQSLIMAMGARMSSFENNDYRQLLQNILTWTRPAASVQKELASSNNPEERHTVEVVKRNDISVPFDKILLLTEDDVTGYVKALEEALREQIRRGRSIQL